jgi:hypothetical protein
MIAIAIELHKDLRAFMLVIGRAMKAVLGGFGLREPFTADASGLAELARQSCLALTALAGGNPAAVGRVPDG